MTITYIIPGATLIDQLNEPTSDGLVDENASDNCVAASLSEGLHILTGKTFNGDELKDAVYGQGFVGFQAASAYVAYCATQGVTLAPHNDTQAGLVATIHAQVSAGHPVIVTMPSQWGTAPADPLHPSGATHVGIAVGVGGSAGSGEIRVMNPWHGFFQDQSDAWWAARLCEGQVWVMQKAGANMATVPAGWTDDGTTLTAPNGYTVGSGFRTYVMTHAWDAADVPVTGEMSVADVELGDATQGGGTVQYFQQSQLAWTAQAGVRLVALGVEAARMRAQIGTLATQAQKDAATIGALTSQVAQLQTRITALQTQVAQLQNNATPTPRERAALALMDALKAAQAVW